MRIGVLSDSHGRIETTRRAVAAVVDAGVERLIHLGDIGTEGVIDELVGTRAHLVFGNCDRDDVELARYAELLGMSVDHPCGTVVAAGRTVMFTHGHLDGVMADALAAQPDYLLHGHTHVMKDTRTGRTRVINPGALFRAARYTVAVLDTATDTLEILEIPGSA